MSDFLDRIKAAAKKAGHAMTNPDFDPDAPFARRADDPAPPHVHDEPSETIALSTPPAVRPSAPAGRIPGLDFSDLPPMPDVYVPGGAPADATVRLGSGPTPAPAPMPAEEGQTIAYLKPRVGADPVVGWLVVVAGPDRGRDFRLHAGRNFIGRSPEMHVALTNDRAVSRDRHAIVVYDPRANRYRVTPGESSGLVYCNGAPVDAPQDLTAGDEIELGDTRLRFVPLCSDQFQWDAAPAL